MDDHSQVEAENSPRTYRSEKRRRQAEATRQAIIAAGRRLFITQGYAATTVAQIAAEAGVSEPTVYASVGGKRGILLALVELVDDLGDAAIIQEAMAQTDPRRFIQLAIKYNRQVLERGGDVIQFVMMTASLDEDVAAVLADVKERNRMVAGELAEGLVQRSRLQPHLTLKQAGDIIGAMLMPGLYDTLRSYGWSFDECETWVADTLVKILLLPD